MYSFFVVVGKVRTKTCLVELRSSHRELDLFLYLHSSTLPGITWLKDKQLFVHCSSTAIYVILLDLSIMYLLSHERHVILGRP